MVHSHMASQNCCRPIYFDTGKTQVTCLLLQKNLCKLSLLLLAAMKHHMTSKSGFKQTDPTADVINMFMLKSVWDRVQVLLPKCLFQDEVLSKGTNFKKK